MMTVVSLLMRIDMRRRAAGHVTRTHVEGKNRERRRDDALRLDDHRRAELDALVDPHDVRVPHADAAAAHGLPEQLGVRRSVDADGPPGSVRESDPAMAERIVR